MPFLSLTCLRLLPATQHKDVANSKDEQRASSVATSSKGPPAPPSPSIFERYLSLFYSLPLLPISDVGVCSAAATTITPKHYKSIQLYHCWAAPAARWYATRVICVTPLPRDVRRRSASFRPGRHDVQLYAYIRIAAPRAGKCVLCFRSADRTA